MRLLQVAFNDAQTHFCIAAAGQDSVDLVVHKVEVANFPVDGKLLNICRGKIQEIKHKVGTWCAIAILCMDRLKTYNQIPNCLKCDFSLLVQRRENALSAMITLSSEHPNRHQMDAWAATQASLAYRVMGLVCERSADRIPGEPPISSPRILLENM